MHLSMLEMNQDQSSSCAYKALSDTTGEIASPSLRRSFYANDDLSQGTHRNSSMHTEGNSGEELTEVTELGSLFTFRGSQDRYIAELCTPRRELGRSSGGGRSLSTHTSPLTWLQSSIRHPSLAASPCQLYSPSHSLDSDLTLQLPGCIFDYEDPWDAIGTMMGLPPNNPTNTTLEEELAALGATEFGSAKLDDDFDDQTLDDSGDDSGDERTSSTAYSPRTDIHAVGSLSVTSNNSLMNGHESICARIPGSTASLGCPDSTHLLSSCRDPDELDLPDDLPPNAQNNKTKVSLSVDPVPGNDTCMTNAMAPIHSSHSAIHMTLLTDRTPSPVEAKAPANLELVDRACMESSIIPPPSCLRSPTHPEPSADECLPSAKASIGSEPNTQTPGSRPLLDSQSYPSDGIYRGPCLFHDDSESEST